MNESFDRTRVMIRLGVGLMFLSAGITASWTLLRRVQSEVTRPTSVASRATRPGIHGITRSQPTTKPRPIVDYATPSREYLSRRAAGWKVMVEKELVTREPQLAERALSRLTGKLDEIERVLPAYSLGRLRQIPFFLFFGEESSLKGRPEGAEYFAPSAPAHNPRLDARMASSIAIYSARHFTCMTDFGAKKMILHELSHGWHLEQWPEDKPEIVAAYQNAMDKHLYANVRKSDGTIQAEAYAAVNQLEYFAEISCVWFCGNDHFPFERGDLRLYDPMGYALIQKLWTKHPSSGSVIVVR